MTETSFDDEFHDGGRARPRTLASKVFDELRKDILSGRLPPGAKLRFDELREAYGVGLSPLREALSRLAENRLVESTGQRGFRVPSASVAEIQDIAMVRKEVDGLALRRSIELGDDGWEANIVATRHKLSMLSRDGRQVTEEDWENRHREFHYALVAGCQSKTLLHLHNLLSDQFDRYRRLSATSRLPNSPRPLVHQKLHDAALERDAERAIELLHHHIDEATELILAGIENGSGS